MKKYPRINLKTAINIDHLIGISYRSVKPFFSDNPESHDFWELVYIDSGEINVVENDIVYPLTAGEFYLHRPNYTHYLSLRETSNPKFIIATFDCDSPELASLETYKFKANNACKNIITNLLNELHHTHNVKIFKSIFIATPNEEREEDKVSLQCIKMYLELFFINVLRSAGTTPNKNAPEYNEENYHIPICEDVIIYLKENIYNSITLDKLCYDLNCGKTKLCSSFKAHTGQGIMQYYLNLKINEAKTLLLKDKYNISQISDMLKFSSPYYFSACFKRCCGISPQKYRMYNS